MKKSNKINSKKFMTWEEHKNQLMKNPKFVKAYKEFQQEMAIIRKIIESRIKRGITQKRLANKMATKQSAISRLESGTANSSLNFLQRLAKALDCRLEIRFVPK